jgi:glycosyltransferase involved in cell wall biosynthesis
MMRIAYIAPAIPSASETFVYREILGLRSRGIQVTVASVYRAKSSVGNSQVDALADEAISVYSQGIAKLLVDAFKELLVHPWRSIVTCCSILRDIACARVTLRTRMKLIAQGMGSLALAHRLRPHKVMHIHAHFAHVPATIAMYAARQLEIGFSFTGHANDLFVRRCLLEEKLDRAQFVACISHWHRQFFIDLKAAPTAEKFPIIRCGVDVRDIRMPQNCSVPLIMGVGRMIPKKGFDILIDSLGALAAQGAKFQCRLIGGGPEYDSLVARAKACSLDEAIEFAGALGHEDVLQNLMEADMFVLPCRPAGDGDRDGIPVVLMEAMAAGIPVVSGDLPAIRELITNDSTGLLVPSGDKQALASAIRSLLEDPARRAQLGKAGRERVREEFSTEQNLDRLIEAFEHHVCPSSSK